MMSPRRSIFTKEDQTLKQLTEQARCVMHFSSSPFAIHRLIALGYVPRRLAASETVMSTRSSIP
jgi:hypothetical protein